MLKKEINRENNREINNIYAQNCKTEKKKVEKSKSENLESEEPIEQRFERFYKIYPKKKSKGKALNWFKTHKPGSSLVDTMIESIKRQKQTIDWQKQNGRYIPYPATWLNARGWENQIEPQEIADLSENSVSRLLAKELYETLKRKEFTLTTDTQKLVKSWAIDIEEYLFLNGLENVKIGFFYAIKAIENSDKWRKIIIDAKSLIKNIEFIKG